MADGAHAVDSSWPTAVDLAGLPDVPTTSRGVRDLAARQAWRSRPRKGRGGGREYNPEDLPEATRAEWRRRRAISIARRGRDLPEVRRMQIADSIERAARWREVQRGVVEYAGFTGIKKRRSDARVDAVGALRDYASARGLAMSAAAPDFLSDYLAGAIELPPGSREILGDQVSVASLMRWDRKLRLHGPACLAGRYGNRAGSGIIDRHQELQHLLLSLLVDKPHLNARHAHRALEARFDGTEIPVPALRSVQRWLTRWKREHRQLYTAVRNPDEWKNKFKAAFGSASEGITRLNQRWELDSTVADVMLTDGRYVIVQIVDVWSRRRMFHVSRSSSAEALCQVFRRALLEWGVPELVKIDNGQDYVSHRFMRVCKDLDIEVKTSAPFSPWEKPHVESGFRTFSHDLLEMLPGFVGHNVSDAQAIRAKESFAERLFKKNAKVEIRMSAADLQTFCDRWTRDVYERESRSALKGMSVFERVASWTGEVRRIEDERLLDVLLAEAPDGTGGRTVGKKGIRVDKLWYGAPELVALIGERVHVRYDASDVGRIWVFHDDEFVCVATCPEVLGVSREELALEAKARQTEAVQQARRELKAIARKVKTDELVGEILDAKAAEAERVIALPATNVTHITPALDEAAQAAAAEPDAGNGLPPLPPLERADLARLRDTNRAEQEQNQREETDFRRWLDLKLKPSSEWCETDHAFFAGFDDTPAQRKRWALFTSWGPKGMGLPDDPYLQLLPNGPEIDLMFPMKPTT